MSIVPVRKRPGLYYNTDSGKYFNLVEYRDDDKYDTVVLASGAVAAGKTLECFRDLGSKDKIDTNFDTPRRISKGEEMLVKRIGVDIPMAVGNTIQTPANIKKVAYNGYMRFQVNKKDVAEGPLYKFPSGYGLAGQTTENATGIVSIGVPSTAAQRPLEKVHEVTSEHDLIASIRFDAHDWDATGQTPSLGSRVWIRVFLGGLVRAAATK